MSRPQRYERINTADESNHIQGQNTYSADDQHIPNSPPPSFRSRNSSPTSHRFLRHEDPLAPDNALHDAFDSPSDDEHDDFEDASEDVRDRRRLIPETPGTRGDTATEEQERTVERRPVSLPAFQPTTGRVYGAGNGNDGVFANLSAKPARGEQEDEKPPSYEAAAADATPPYWETTILAPGMMSDEVYVDGLPVGSVFSFLWNAMISTTFDFMLIGFFLTYLLSTTHAARNGSRAGLGFTFVKWGFTFKGTGMTGGSAAPTDPSTGYLDSVPSDPNAHDYAPDPTAGDPTVGDPTMGGFAPSDWFSYTLMIVGWFILIRSVSEFYRARRHEQLVLQSPDRGLGVAVVAEGETAETAV